MPFGTGVKALLLVLLIGGLALGNGGPTPPPGVPLPGPPPLLEPAGPSRTPPALTAPPAIAPLSTLREPSGRAVPSSGAVPSGASGTAPGPSPSRVSQSAVPAVQAARRSSPWIGLGAVLVITGAVGWFIARRRRHG